MEKIGSMGFETRAIHVVQEQALACTWGII